MLTQECYLGFAIYVKKKMLFSFFLEYSNLGPFLVTLVLDLDLCMSYS